MSISSRQEQILKIINDRNFITVNELAKITFTSPSSIRRDLTYMQNKGLVRRTHGGASVPEMVTGVASFYDRMHKNTNAKREIARKASTLLSPRQSIILDGSSTVSFLLPYIAKLHSSTVFTNNLSTAMQSIELGINTHCLGGSAINNSVVLSGPETYTAISNIKADIIFFSSQGLNADGTITDSTQEENYVTELMLNAAKNKVFLCDSEKFNKVYLYKLCNLDNIDYVVFDRDFNELSTSCDVL